MYGSLYVTLCFVLCPFVFGVLTIYFCILSSLFVYNVANFKRRNSRSRAKMENKTRKEKREYKYFNSSVVMLVFIYLKSMQPLTITVKKSNGSFLFDYATYWVLTVKVVTHTKYYSI